MLPDARRRNGRGAAPKDQLRFWSLTFSFMFKLVSLGLTIFVFPFNDWIHLTKLSAGPILMRGISGSDCIQSTNNQNQFEIDCVKWSLSKKDPNLESKRFWSKLHIRAEHADPPTENYYIVYYLFIGQIFAFIIDLGITLVMCCNYKRQSFNSKNQMSLSLYGIYLVCAFFSVLLVSNNAYDFPHSYYNVSFGVAFWIYIGAIFLSLCGQVLAHLNRINVLYNENETHGLNKCERVLHVIKNFNCFIKDYPPPTDEELRQQELEKMGTDIDFG